MLTAVGVGARVYGRFQKLPPASNGKFLRCLVVFFSLHMAKHGPELLLDQLERVQVPPRRRARTSPPTQRAAPIGWARRAGCEAACPCRGVDWRNRHMPVRR